MPPLNDITWVLPLRTDLLTSVFSLFPLLVNDVFLIFSMAIGYWIIDKHFFRNFGALVCISILINTSLKVIFAIPRPNIERLLPIYDNSYSFPSSDMQVATVFWLALAIHFKNRVLWCTSIGIILGVAISRVYLGMHTPIDIFGGFVAGAALVWLFNQMQSFRVPLIMGLGLLILYAWSMHGNWYLESKLAFGALLGITAGSFFEQVFDHHRVPSSGSKKYSLLTFGFISTYLLTWMLKPTILLIQRTPSTFNMVSAYALITFYILFGVPLIFCWLEQAVKSPVLKDENKP